MTYTSKNSMVTLAVIIQSGLIFLSKATNTSGFLYNDKFGKIRPNLFKTSQAYLFFKPQ